MKTTLIVIVCLVMIPAAFAQQQIGSNSGLYGVTAFKVNGQAVASQYALWSIPSSGAVLPNTFSFPA